MFRDHIFLELLDDSTKVMEHSNETKIPLHPISRCCFSESLEIWPTIRMIQNSSTTFHVTEDGINHFSFLPKRTYIRQVASVSISYLQQNHEPDMWTSEGSHKILHIHKKLMPNEEDQILNILPSRTLPQTFECKTENLCIITTILSIG